MLAFPGNMECVRFPLPIVRIPGECQESADTMEHEWMESQDWMGGAIRPDLIMESGNGCWLKDREGREYLDFVSGWAVNSLGHCPEEIATALERQAKTLLHCSPGFWNGPGLALAAKLKQLTGLDRVFLGCTGAEANECAIKLARLFGKKRRSGAYGIVTTHGGFHGRTLATMAATGKGEWRGLFGPDLTGFVQVLYGDLEAMELAVTDSICAVMLEPIQGEAGVVPASAQYLRGLRELCDRKGVLLILDEVQTGIGRTGDWTVGRSVGVRPDILTLGKGLGGGVPVSACLCREEWNLFEPGNQGGTFTYHPLGSAVALAVLVAIETRGLLANVREQGMRMASIVSGLAGRYGLLNLRGQGLLQAFDLPQSTASDLVVIARGQGLLLNAPRPGTVRLMPPLTVDAVEMETFRVRLDESLVLWQER
jgi:acetylornithine/N-succinyldiaminopimelate aminotransferase